MHSELNLGVNFLLEIYSKIDYALVRLYVEADDLHLRSYLSFVELVYRRRTILSEKSREGDKQRSRKPKRMSV